MNVYKFELTIHTSYSGGYWQHGILIGYTFNHRLMTDAKPVLQIEKGVLNLNVTLAKAWI